MTLNDFASKSSKYYVIDFMKELEYVVKKSLQYKIVCHKTMNTFDFGYFWNFIFREMLLLFSYFYFCKYWLKI